MEQRQQAADRDANNVDFTSSEFKNTFYKALLKAGIIDKLRSQLRSSLIDQLKARTNVNLAQKHLHSEDYSTFEGRSIEERAIESLIIGYLGHKSYEFSLSVFLPECCTNEQQIVSKNDLLKFFHLDHRLNGGNETGCLLVDIMRFISQKLSSNVHDRQVQTAEDGGGVHLLHKLRQIDDEFGQKISSGRASTQASLEERMIAYQYECDQRLKQEIIDQMDVYRKNELESMRVEERARYEAEIDKLKHEFDRDEDDRRKRLQSSEQEISERLQRKEKEFEREAYQERQRLLSEFESLKLRENALKREAELNDKAMKLEEAKVKQKFEEALQQYHEAQKIKEEFAVRLRDEVQKYQLQFDREHAHILTEIREQKTKLETERHVIAEKLEQLEYLKGHSGNLQKELSTTKDQLQSSDNEVRTLRKENDVLKQTIMELKQSQETIQYQAKTVSSSLEVETTSLRNKVAELERALLQKDRELSSLTKNREDQSDYLHKVKKTGLKWQKHAQHLQLRLESLLAENDDLNRRIDDFTLRNKELSKEVSDVRLLLHHAQSALQSELPFTSHGHHDHQSVAENIPYYNEALNDIANLKRSVASQSYHKSNNTYDRSRLDVDYAMKAMSQHAPLKMSDLYSKASTCCPERSVRQEDVIQAYFTDSTSLPVVPKSCYQPSEVQSTHMTEPVSTFIKPEKNASQTSLPSSEAQLQISTNPGPAPVAETRVAPEIKTATTIPPQADNRQSEAINPLKPNLLNSRKPVQQESVIFESERMKPTESKSTAILRAQESFAFESEFAKSREPASAPLDQTKPLQVQDSFITLESELKQADKVPAGQIEEIIIEEIEEDELSVGHTNSEDSVF